MSPSNDAPRFAWRRKLDLHWRERNTATVHAM